VNKISKNLLKNMMSLLIVLSITSHVWANDVVLSPKSVDEVLEKEDSSSSATNSEQKIDKNSFVEYFYNDMQKRFDSDKTNTYKFEEILPYEQVEKVMFECADKYNLKLENLDLKLEDSNEKLGEQEEILLLCSILKFAKLIKERTGNNNDSEILTFSELMREVSKCSVIGYAREISGEDFSSACEEAGFSPLKDGSQMSYIGSSNVKVTGLSSEVIEALKMRNGADMFYFEIGSDFVVFKYKNEKE